MKFERKDLYERAVKARGDLQRHLTVLAKKAGEFKLNDAQATFDALGPTLNDRQFQFLVAGQVSSGKSYFINGLAGTDLLPTGDLVVTRVAAELQHAEQESFNARFSDGFRTPITRAEFQQLASQQTPDAELEQRLATDPDDPVDPESPPRELTLLEAKVPFEFLPPSVSLIDSCGYGGTYSAHRINTLMMVKQSDGVIYVLDSEKGQIGQEDLELLEEIIAITPNVFFVQTKIDEVNTVDWEKTKSKSEAVLRETFGNRLPDPKVWPISSKRLHQARAATGAERDELLAKSRFNELLPALQYFMLRVSAWSHTMAAFGTTVRAHRDGLSTLRRWKTDCETDRGDALKTQLELLKTLRDEHKIKWGSCGEERLKLIADLAKIRTTERTRFVELIGQNGGIEADLNQQIENLTSATDAKKKGADIVVKFCETAQEGWITATSETPKQLNETIQKVVQEFIDKVAATDTSTKVETYTGKIKVEDGLWDKLKDGGRSEAMSVSFFGGLAIGIVSIVSVKLAAVAAIPLVGVLIWRTLVGICEGAERQLDRAKRDLRGQVAKERIRLNAFYLRLQKGVSKTVVDEFFEDMEAKSDQAVTDVEGKMKQKLNDEIERIEKVTTARKEELEEMAAKYDRQITEWINLSEPLQLVGDELNSLEKTKPDTESAAPPASEVLTEAVA